MSEFSTDELEKENVLVNKADFNYKKVYLEVMGGLKSYFWIQHL